MDVIAHGHGPLTRRSFLTVLGAAAGGAMVPVGSASAATPTGTGFTGRRAVSTAMHVHGTWSEGGGSWESQFAQASRLGIDLLCMTDHDHRALAYEFLPNLGQARFDVLSSGAAASRVAVKDGGSVHLRVESAGGRATSGLHLETRPMAINRLRTNIAGQTLQHTFGAVQLDPGTTYEVVITLSRHEASGGRPRGQLVLRYRFGHLARGRHLEGSGLVGVVTAPVPAAGSRVDLTPRVDVAALWPDTLALDNVTYALEFQATSTGPGSVADVTVHDVQFVRSQSNAADIRTNQQQVIEYYKTRFPGIVARADTEVSQQDPHLNVFGVPQLFPDQADTERDTFEAYYPKMVDRVHQQGGVVSYNHPFGSEGGAGLPPAQQADKRRQVFAQMWANDLYGTDILEVGYVARGGVDLQTHLALWDTFSRRARFLTGNGVNDDHEGKDWASIVNGFATGIWAASRGDAAVSAALASGRAYAKELGTWPDGEIDLKVDGSVPMGKASVSSAASRKLAVYVGDVPPGGSVEIVQGLVDYAGNDPQTFVLATVPASAFPGGTGTVVRAVDTTTSCFVRAQVRTAAGRVVGVANPVWLLREVPPRGIPAARRA